MRPLKFKAILKPTIWAGKEVARIKHAEGQAPGESWEISGVPGDETPVDGGEHDGQTLAQLTETYGAKLVGRSNWERYGTTFPLLVKFISADSDLSIQVHPDDAMAQRMGHPYGKTEMWYIVKTEPNATLCTGFAHDFSADAYTQSLSDGSLASHLNRCATRPGDCFFIPAGRIHSICAGNFLVEIQQSSNDTFRVYDFDRTDSQGRKRELHVEQAREALDYKACPNFRTEYTPAENRPVTLVECPQFTTRLLQLSAPLQELHEGLDSFVILVAYEGEAVLTDSEGGETTLQAGESILFPADNLWKKIRPASGGRFCCLETYVG